MQVCYVAFWDEVTLSSQESAEHRIDGYGFIGKWRIVVVRDLPFADQRLNGKIPKVTTFRVGLYYYLFTLLSLSVLLVLFNTIYPDHATLFSCVIFFFVFGKKLCFSLFIIFSRVTYFL